MHLPRPRLVAGALLAAGTLGLSSWQAQLSRYSPQAQWMVGSLVVAALGAAVALGHWRQQWTARRWAGRNWEFMRSWRARPPGAVVSAVVWTVLIAGIVGWDLASFASQSHSLPTLSFFIGHITRSRIGRGLLFALWLGLGAYLVGGRRVESPR